MPLKHSMSQMGSASRYLLEENGGITTISNHINNEHINENKTETLKFYKAIIFSGPIVFTLIILFLFYFFYLRRRSFDWSSLGLRHSRLHSVSDADAVVEVEVGLKKEYREMLPVVVFKESFCVKDTQCSVCLGDYLAEDKLQQIPGCGHTFHLSCIDHWLSNHTNCPLCRHSLITSTKTPPASDPDNHTQD